MYVHLLCTGRGGKAGHGSTMKSNRRVDAHLPPQCRVQPSTDTQEDIDWTISAQSYLNVNEAPSFISQHKQAAGQHIFPITGNSANLQEKQLQVYSIVQQHHTTNSPPPLRMIVSGTAGTRKLYLIHCFATCHAASGCCCSSNWGGYLQR